MPTVCIIKSRKYPLGEKDIVDGGTFNAHVIASELQRSGYNIEVFTRNEGNEQGVVNQQGIRIFRVPFIRSANSNVLIRDYEEGKSFVESVISHSEFNPEKYTCIHTHHWTSGVGLESHIPAHTKLIHTPHLLAAEKAYYNKLPFPSYVKKAEQTLLGRANHIIALSKSEETAICTIYGCDARKIIIAPNGIDDVFFEIPSLDTKIPHPLFILYIGRSCRQKGIDILLDATERIIESGVPISLRLVGGPYGEPEVDKIIKERVQRAPLSGVVDLIGEVTHNRVPSLLRDSFVYTQPSRYESQGIALLEAMAAGR
ncbi:MAG: glycosyltransferase, partial [Patescibacteria group bacterium]